MAHPRQDDVEWLDDEGAAAPRDEEELAAGAARPPLRRRTRIALGALAVVLVGVAVTVAATGGDDEQQATPTRTVPPSSTVAPAPVVPLPSRPPTAALAAIRAVFPTAELTGFSAARAAGTERDVYLFYNVAAGRRLITITLGPSRPGETDAVLRTASSIEIAQPLGRQRVDILLRTEPGAPTAKDFAAVQRLVQDARLLAGR